MSKTMAQATKSVTVAAKKAPTSKTAVKVSKSEPKTGGKPLADDAEVSPAASVKPPVKSPSPAPTPQRAAHTGSAAVVTSPMSPSRFADRFAPPKPPTRQMAQLADDDVVRPVPKADPKLANAWKGKAGRDLTEAELLSMPDGEYMNDKQLEFFRTRLQALKDDLLSNAGETTEHLREDTSIVPDPADRATIEEEHALELRTRDRERKLLKKISQSLARIDAGEYGFCDETGEPIGLGRLIARPTATLSLEAQQRRELKQKMFGD